MFSVNIRFHLVSAENDAGSKQKPRETHLARRYILRRFSGAQSGAPPPRLIFGTVPGSVATGHKTNWEF
jgi:hypothetical protein